MAERRHVGPRNERANVKFGQFFRFFESETEIRGFSMEKSFNPQNLVLKTG